MIFQYDIELQVSEPEMIFLEFLSYMYVKMNKSVILSLKAALFYVQNLEFPIKFGTYMVY